MQHARFIGGIASRVTPLDEADRPILSAVSPCWTRSISPLVAVIACSNRLMRGQKLIVQLADIGGFLGQVERFVEGGYAVRLLLDDAGREKLSAKIVWYRLRVLHASADNRTYKRWRPANRHSVVLLADGKTAPCLVLDVSASGVAMSSGLKPDLGTPLAIGQLVGKVVRHLDAGFAVQFQSIQDERTVERMLLPIASQHTSVLTSVGKAGESKVLANHLAQDLVATELPALVRTP